MLRKRVYILENTPPSLGEGESTDVIWGKKIEKAKRKRGENVKKKEERGKKMRKGEVKGQDNCKIGKN
jgi:hypothetical protein